MEKSEMVIRTLINDDKKFVVSKDLESVCNKYNLNYNKTRRLLLNAGSMITIFRGVFYVKDYNEKKTGVIEYSPDELIAKGLELKGIRNWYFGLKSGLKFLNVTHEYFTRTWILNDTMKRKLRGLAGASYEFVKMKRNLFEFGIKTEKTKNGFLIKYSDREKTLLDIAYLYKKKGKSDYTAKQIFLEYEENLDKERLFDYSKKYPKTIQKLVKEL